MSYVVIAAEAGSERGRGRGGWVTNSGFLPRSLTTVDRVRAFFPRFLPPPHLQSLGPTARLASALVSSLSLSLSLSLCLSDSGTRTRTRTAERSTCFSELHYISLRVTLIELRWQ